MISNRRLAAFLCALPLLALAACAAPDGAGPASAGAAVEGDFDEARSEALLAEARAAQEAGRLNAAIDLYRQAALSWPDNRDAWVSLRDLSTEQGMAEDAAAAEFMIGRIDLYPSDQFYVQREVNRALKIWANEAEATPDANATQIAYVRKLSDFYDWRYAMRGGYDAPRPFLNARAKDIPAVILSGGGVLVYLGTLATESASGQ